MQHYEPSRPQPSYRHGQTSGGPGIPGMRSPYEQPASSATPIYDSLCAEYRRLLRALPGDRSGEEELRFAGFGLLLGTAWGTGGWQVYGRHPEAPGLGYAGYTSPAHSPSQHGHLGGSMAGQVPGQVSAHAPTHAPSHLTGHTAGQGGGHMHAGTHGTHPAHGMHGGHMGGMTAPGRGLQAALPPARQEPHDPTAQEMLSGG